MYLANLKEWRSRRDLNWDIGGRGYVYLVIC